MEGVAPLLAGLNWSWIPYTHPGIPLAIRIQQESDKRPDVLLLENHGLVVAAADCVAAENLLKDVERRLNCTIRQAPEADLERLGKLASGEWKIADDAEVHALAMLRKSYGIAADGTLFPDQCVYLGPGAAVAQVGEPLDEAAARYQKRYDFKPMFLIVAGAGIVTRRDIKRAARELLICLKRVIERIPDDAQATYLPVSQVARLMNWDAEKYRIEMART